MTAKEIIPILKAWQERLLEFEKQQDALHAVLGIEIESPFMNAVNAIILAYSNEISEKIGDTKDGERGYIWLSWWAYECNFGKEPKQAKRKEWKRMRTIKTIKQLSELIAE